ncbi:MAG: hypothetical protein K0S33_3956 [Bacteroidetes bacterium]|jgi:hypothetical protein|nr:hypothetical protein [Bacteroidota bacterium]
MIKKLTLSALLVTVSTGIFAQEDLLSLVNEPEKPKNEKVFATFKTTKIVNAQSIETVKKNTLDFRITHRFSDIAVGGSGHTLWGFDNSTDIRYSFDYGITDQLMVGFARSKYRELLEGYAKWRFLEQTTNNKIPLTIAAYTSMGFTPILQGDLYAGTDKSVEKKDVHRFSYFSQLILARKFNSWFSLQLMPSYHHRNFVRADVNADNGAEETNGIVSLGIGGRLRFTKRMAFIVDYFYNISKYREGNTLNPYYNPLAVGLEIETGGHVFHLNFTNNGAISENNFIPYTQSNWLDGQFKFGFNISRVFNF